MCFVAFGFACTLSRPEKFAVRDGLGSQHCSLFQMQTGWVSDSSSHGDPNLKVIEPLTQQRTTSSHATMAREKSEKEKVISGELYCAGDKELTRERTRARVLM